MCVFMSSTRSNYFYLFIFNTSGSIGPGVKNKEKIKSKCGMVRGPDRHAE